MCTYTTKVQLQNLYNQTKFDEVRYFCFENFLYGFIEGKSVMSCLLQTTQELYPDIVQRLKELRNLQAKGVELEAFKKHSEHYGLLGEIFYVKTEYYDPDLNYTKEHEHEAFLITKHIKLHFLEKLAKLHGIKLQGTVCEV